MDATMQVHQTTCIQFCLTQHPSSINKHHHVFQRIQRHCRLQIGTHSGRIIQNVPALPKRSSVSIFTRIFSVILPICIFPCGHQRLTLHFLLAQPTWQRDNSSLYHTPQVSRGAHLWLPNWDITKYKELLTGRLKVGCRTCTRTTHLKELQVAEVMFILIL